MSEKYFASDHQAHDNEREYIAGFNQPTAAEQARARAHMTDEQKAMSEEREREYERQGREQSFQLMADISSITAYRGEKHGHSKEEFGNKGYSRDERLWISNDGKIYFRQELDSFHDSIHGNTERYNSKELTREEALSLIKMSKDFAGSSIESLKDQIREFKSLQDRLTVAQKRINNLPKSEESK